MRLLVIGLIAVALGAAVTTAFLAKRFLDAQKVAQTELASAAVPDSEEKSLVLVADSDITAGTVLPRSLLRWQVWPADDVRSEFSSAKIEDAALTKKFVGMVARHGIRAGTPLTAKMVFPQDQPGFLAGALEKGLRAVSIAVTETTGAAGFILPGNFVDVIMTFDVSRTPNLSDEEKKALSSTVLKRTAETVLRKVRVIAIGQKFDDLESKAEVVKNVTLAVTRKQAERLAVASTMGKISLALRGLGDESTEDEKDSFTTDLQMSPTLRNSLERARAKAKAKVKPRQKSRPTRKRRPARRKVRIIRGGEESTKEF